jgi:hypothetical protein
VGETGDGMGGDGPPEIGEWDFTWESEETTAGDWVSESWEAEETIAGDWVGGEALARCACVQCVRPRRIWSLNFGSSASPKIKSI